MFAVVGLLLSILAYRENLPLTMKSCFYPLIGDCIFGWIGDVIDVISILATLFGVCTSLGIAARQVNMGIYVVFPSVDSENTTIQVIILRQKCLNLYLSNNAMYFANQ